MTDNAVAARRLYASHGADWLVDRADSSYTDALLVLLRTHMAAADSVLDVCCGYGRLMLPLLRQGFNVMGVDISETLLTRARELARESRIGRLPFLQGDLTALPFADATFDFSYCVWASFNFLVSDADQRRALEEMHRVMRPGGRALIECPCHETAAPVQSVAVGGVTYDYRPITVAEMQALAAASPFAGHTVVVERIGGRERLVALLRTVG